VTRLDEELRVTRSLKGPASNAREVVHSAKGKSETILKFTWYKCNLRLSVSKLHLYIYMFQIALYAIHHKYTVQVYIQKSTEAKLCLNHQTLQFYNAKLNDHFFFVVLLACGTSPNMYFKLIQKLYLLTHSLHGAESFLRS